jgi:hypothetical protein
MDVEENGVMFFALSFRLLWTYCSDGTWNKQPGSWHWPICHWARF